MDYDDPFIRLLISYGLSSSAGGETLVQVFLPRDTVYDKYREIYIDAHIHRNYTQAFLLRFLTVSSCFLHIRSTAMKRKGFETYDEIYRTPI